MVVSRDYLTIKIWDLRQTQKPQSTLLVTDYLERRLCDLYVSENIFDKFDVAVSPDGSHILTGAYNGSFHVMDVEGKRNTTVQAEFKDKRGRNVGEMKENANRRLTTHLSNQGELNLLNKIKNCAWHPFENSFAVTQHNLFFLYSEKRHSPANEA